MKSPSFWGMIYLFMGFSFIFFAIQQKGRTGEWDLITIALIAIAAYDFMVANKYFRMKKNIGKK